ncbi:MAG: NAD-binding protein [Imperialibacter sp.]
MKNYPFREKLNYKFDNLMSAGPVALITYLTIFSTVILSVFTCILFFANIHPDEALPDGYINTLWFGLMHTLDPGTLAEHEGDWIYKFWMFVVTGYGIIALSTLIGLISNGIMDKIDRLRKGRSRIVDDGHVLILGWSSKIYTIVSELIIANENQKDPLIVILADKDKIEMEDKIRDKIPDHKNTKIVCRTGDPIDLHDLDIGNPAGSKSIIILDKENENSDSQIIKTILAITSSDTRRETPYHITAEIKHSENYEVAKMVGKEEVELILSDEFVSKVMVQTSLQSGLSVVYTELMDFGGDEIYFMEEPKLIGKTFREAVFSYEDSAIIGMQSADDTEIQINPPMNKLLQKGDKLIGITEDDDTMVVSGKPFAIDERRIVRREKKPSIVESILIIGWNHRASLVIRELDKYVDEGSTVHIISKFDLSEERLEKLQASLENIRLEFQHSDTTDRTELEKLNCQQYNYIIMLCYQDDFPPQEADAQTLITLLHLRNILESAPTKVNLVSEMMDIRNRQLADVTSADDFIVSDKLLSLLMTQVAENKYLMRVFEELLDADGAEIYIKPITDYISLEENSMVTTNFYTVLESAARQNEIAIGYRHMSDAKNVDMGYGVVVNPKKSDLIEFSWKDRVIVISES